MELSLEDIKQELQDYYCNQTIIDEYEKSNGKIEDLYNRATKTTTTISDMPKGISEIMDRAAECVSEIVDLRQKNSEVINNISEYVAEIVDLQQKTIQLEKDYAVEMMKLKNRNLIIHETIMSLDNPYHKAVLFHVYVSNKTREATAEILNCSKRWVDKLVGFAFLSYLKVRNKNLQKI